MNYPAVGRPLCNTLVAYGPGRVLGPSEDEDLASGASARESGRVFGREREPSAGTQPLVGVVPALGVGPQRNN